MLSGVGWRLLRKQKSLSVEEMSVYHTCVVCMAEHDEFIFAVFGNGTKSMKSGRTLPTATLICSHEKNKNTWTCVDVWHADDKNCLRFILTSTAKWPMTFMENRKSNFEKSLAIIFMQHKQLHSKSWILQAMDFSHKYRFKCSFYIWKYCLKEQQIKTSD